MHYIDNVPLNDSRCEKQLGDWTVPDEFENISGGVSPTLDSIDDDKAMEFAIHMLGRHGPDKKVLVLIVGSMLMHFREWWDMMLSHPKGQFKKYADHIYSNRIMFSAMEVGLSEDKIFEFGDKIELEFVKANYAYVGYDVVRSVLKDNSHMVKSHGLMGMTRHTNGNVNATKALVLDVLKEQRSRARSDRVWQKELLDAQKELVVAQKKLVDDHKEVLERTKNIEAMMKGQLSASRDATVSVVVVEEEEEEKNDGVEAEDEKRRAICAGHMVHLYKSLGDMELVSV